LFVAVEQEGALLSAQRLLTDEMYRERVIPRVNDSIVRAFWQQEFASWNKAYTEAVAAVTNKMQPFLTNRSARATVSLPVPPVHLPFGERYAHAQDAAAAFGIDANPG
jgi:hypothetical protein